MMPCRPIIASAVALGLVSGVPGSDIAPHLATLLSSDLKFSADDLRDLEQGKVVRHGLAPAAPGEIAVVGAVRIRAHKGTLVNDYRDIVRFKRGPEVLQIGRFSNPPTMADLAGLTIDNQDVNLRNCYAGDCDIRLPAAAIERVRRDIDWTARDADARADALFKELLLDHVRAYMIGGPGRITEYDDDKRPIRPVDDFIGLLNRSPYVATLVPGLDQHLRAFPGGRLNGAEDLVYWSKEKFGLSPFITVTHVTITRDAAGDAVMTSKDVYSSRYIDASLTLTIASDTASTPDAFYLLYVNRSRASALTGAFAGLRRRIVERRAKNSLDDNLTNLKVRFERGF